VEVRHDEGVAIRIDPEPCADARKGGHCVAALGCPHPRRGLVICSRRKRAWLLITAPVRRWHSRQWQIAMRDGSPSIVR